MSKSTQPLLTIILPLYNAGEDVQSLFASLSMQENIDSKKIDILVVDDGSSDATLEYVQKYTPLLSDYRSVAVVKNKSNLGLSKTRHIGATTSTAKFITFVDKKTRPDPDYIYSFLAKNRNIIIGSPYISKQRGIWPRVLSLVRKKLYWPYFNNDFEDVDLDRQAYVKFKNKGGGGAMLVLRKYYVKISSKQSHNPNVNDDSKFIEELAAIEPILKTNDARTEYLNRTGHTENVLHLFNRGPKFIDYYFTKDSRFLPFILGLIMLPPAFIAIYIYSATLVLALFAVGAIAILVLSIYVSEDLTDLYSALLILPVSLIAFCAGVYKGLFMKITNRY